MAKLKPLIDADEENNEGLVDEIDRTEDLCGRDEVDDALGDLYQDVKKGFEDQWSRSNDHMKMWDIFFCRLGEMQYYSGNSKIFLPIVHNAVNARVTRFTNQIFPVSGRNVEVISENGDIPHSTMALAEHYIRRARLRTDVIPALMRNGDVEGQYTLYVGWEELKRHVTWRTPDPVDDTEAAQLSEDRIGAIQHAVHYDAGPCVEVIADSDLLVLPHTADSIQSALAMGGSVTVLRRWSKAKIKQEIADGEIDEDKGEALLEEMAEHKEVTPHKAKEMASAAGIKQGSRGGPKYALIFETWTMLTIDDERWLCVVRFGGEKVALSCKRNPYWNDRCPVLSVPIDKVQGSFKGISKISPCAQAQYYANDAVNEAADSSLFALMPIVMTDPNKNPRVGSMVLSLAAVWQVDPNSTKFASMPELWKQGFEIVSNCKGEIAQSLSVSPAAITQGSGGARTKQSQAEVAREQQVDILTTADAVTTLEEGILSPLVTWFIELDHQYREDELMIPEYGEMGRRAAMQMVSPLQIEHAYSFRWFGVEAARTAQQVQQQITMINVLRGIPPQQYEGHRLNLVPVIAQLTENVFGPRLAPLIFEDVSQTLPIPADQENLLLAHGFVPPVHPMDDDQAHLQSHAMLLQQEGMGNKNKILAHLFAHQQAMQKKQMQAQMQMAAMAGGGMPGAPGAFPGGGGGAPGMPGTPRIGAVPGQSRMQGPPGSLAPDQVSVISGGPPNLRQRA